MSHIEKIISERHRVEEVIYSRDFQLTGEDEATGYSFPCDRTGKPDKTDEHYDAWKDNFRYCLEHPEKYEDRGCVETKHSYIEPAYVQCSCGGKIYLQGDTECTCGQWYNQFGQALLPPKYWDDDNYDGGY
jgi:hypothetical protein